jgi:D-alanine--poly(phosphoribitol) ligase subunit 2
VSPQAAIAERIEVFIRTEFDIDPGDTGFGRKVDLFELGYIDSVGFAELLAFLEEEFGVDIPEAELLSEDFLRIEGIASVVSRLISVDPVGIPVLAEEHIP